jgi:hypothetical protein
MSKISIHLTEEEKAEFAKLPKEEQEKFMETAMVARETLMVKTAVLSMLLIESFDSLKEFGLQRQKLKNLGNRYNEELEKYVNIIFDNAEQKGNAADYVAEMSSKINKLF